MKPYDLVVIGTGVAAGTVAMGCAEKGWSVAIVDREPYGGTCQLRGCDSKKMLRRAPEFLDEARHLDGRGIAPAGLHLDWAGMQAHRRSFTDPVPEQRERQFADAGITTLHGIARFTGRTTLAVGQDELQARHVLIASGMKPRPLGIPGAELAITSDQFMELEKLPRRVLFIGGGYISFEFAHMAVRADASVVMLNRGGRPLKGFDPDLVDMLADRSRQAGIDLQNQAEVLAIEATATGLQVRARVDNVPRVFAVDLVVHGAGRVPAIDELDLDKAGVQAGRKGIEVNAYLQSPSNPAVYAAGDAAATEGPPLTPVAALEGKVALANLLEGNHAEPDYKGIPSVVFSIPALARVGLLEEEARAQGLDVEVTFSDMRGWFTVKRVREAHAAAKVLTEKGSGRIVGAHLLGPESSELINLFALAIHAGLPADALKGFTSAYPSAGSDLGYLV
jgi:glutathione reductase (NADPH)